jgi:hypothetical protein
MVQAGVVVSDYATLMVEILKDNASPAAGAVYDAMDMDWAKLVGQISAVYAKKGVIATGPAYRPHAVGGRRGGR